MNVEISVLGRKSVDEAYSVLGTQTIEFNADMLSVLLARPDQEDPRYLRIRVVSPENIKFAPFGSGRIEYIVDNGSRDAPYSDTILLARLGVPAQEIWNVIGQVYEPSSNVVGSPIE